MYASPLIRAQYAARNPASPLPTVRGNDIVYAAHALGMSLFTWSMFWKRVWGFDQGGNGKSWRIGRGILGVMVGCVVAVAWVVGLVLIKGRDGGRDPEGWAWIDVVSGKTRELASHCILHSVPLALIVPKSKDRT